MSTVSLECAVGADVMNRIATPMIGGTITSAILNLLIYPVIYVIWRKRDLPKLLLQAKVIRTAN